MTHSGRESAVQAGTQGSQDTDTLILVHVFAGGQKAVGYSIPRDDVINFPHATFDGITKGKIDGAYAYAYDQYVSDNFGKTSSNALYLGANQAGQAFEVQTVESVTGVHIDHFVVSNIYGFYLLAGQFGGIEVCIKPAPAQGGFPAGANLTDIDTLVYPPSNNSNFNAYADGYSKAKGGPQYLHLDPEQSLAFVRSRDTLPGIDVGRTYRQQAALHYMVWKLKNQGLLNDPGLISSMLSNASQYLLSDQNFNLLDFATNMKALTGSHLSLTTLPDAAAQDGLPAAELPPGSTGTATTGTQSVSAAVFGTRPDAVTRSAAKRAARPAKSSGPSAGDLTVPASARYGIPCVY